MASDPTINIDVRNLFTTRVVKFQIHDGLTPYVEVVFELQADKTRTTMQVTSLFGRFPSTPFTENGDALMTVMTTDGMQWKGFDVIKQEAWKMVEFTTATNKVGGVGTHADVAWDDIKKWVIDETSKPSITHTVNMF